MRKALLGIVLPTAAIFIALSWASNMVVLLLADLMMIHFAVVIIGLCYAVTVLLDSSTNIPS